MQYFIVVIASLDVVGMGCFLVSLNCRMPSDLQQWQQMIPILTRNLT